MRFLSSFAIAITTASTAFAEEIIEEAAAIEKIQQLGGRIHDATPMAMSVAMDPIPVAIIPFWAIVAPLALVSAYLLLSKSRPAARITKAA